MVHRFEASIWEALAMGEERYILAADTCAFNWQSTHPHFGTVIHAVLFGRIDKKGCGEDDEENDGVSGYDDIIMGSDKGIKERLSLLHIVLERGADPYLAAPKSCNGNRIYNSDCEETTCITFAEKSALECLWAAKRVIKLLGSKEWSHELTNIDKAVEILVGTYSCQRNTKVLVSERLLELWCDILQDASTADVNIRIESQNEESSADSAHLEIIPAHAAVLCSASPVLRSMLSSGMKEGEHREIVVADCSDSAVHMLLMLLYTGSVDSLETEPSSAMLLDAVALGHRWQIQHVVDMLDLALSKRLDLQNLEAKLDVALRLQLPCLLASCRAFVSHHAPEVRTRLTKRASIENTAVRTELSRVLCTDGSAASEHAAKRRRTL